MSLSFPSSHATEQTINFEPNSNGRNKEFVDVRNKQRYEIKERKLNITTLSLG